MKLTRRKPARQKMQNKLQTGSQQGAGSFLAY